MLTIVTPKKQLLNIRDRFKQRRLSLGYTQQTLAKMTGVSLGSVKRFESSGEISFKSLLKLSLLLECLDDFSSVASKKITSGEVSIEALQKASVKRKRGVK